MHITDIEIHIYKSQHESKLQNSLTGVSFKLILNKILIAIRCCVLTLTKFNHTLNIK